MTPAPANELCEPPTKVRPAAERANITKRIGWHTFRRSMATLFALKKEGVNAVQSLMRHADPRITMELYAQGEEDSMREAQKHLTGLFLVDLKAIAVPGMVYLGTHPSSQYEHQ